MIELRNLKEQASICRNQKTEIDEKVMRIQNDIDNLSSIRSTHINDSSKGFVFNHKTSSKIKLKENTAKMVGTKPKETSRVRLPSISKENEPSLNRSSNPGKETMLESIQDENQKLKHVLGNWCRRLESGIDSLKYQQEHPLKPVPKSISKRYVLHTGNDEVELESLPRLLKEQKTFISMKILNLDLQNFKKSDKLKIVDKIDEIEDVPNLFSWFIDFIETKMKKLLKQIENIKQKQSKR